MKVAGSCLVMKFIKNCPCDGVSASKPSILRLVEKKNALEQTYNSWPFPVFG